MVFTELFQHHFLFSSYPDPTDCNNGDQKDWPYQPIREGQQKSYPDIMN